MAVKFSKKKATATTTKKNPDGTEEVQQEEQALAKDADGSQQEVSPKQADVITGTPCVVAVDMGYTHNLGNYQSAKIGVSISVPCQHDEVDQVFEYSQSWVNERMEKMIAELGDSAEG